MQWFLEQANGGDVLVLRASGSDGYNQYLYNDLGINVNSVESIVLTMLMLQAIRISIQESYRQKLFGLREEINGTMYPIGEIQISIA